MIDLPMMQQQESSRTITRNDLMVSCSGSRNTHSPRLQLFPLSRHNRRPETESYIARSSVFLFFFSSLLFLNKFPLYDRRVDDVGIYHSFTLRARTQIDMSSFPLLFSVFLFFSPVDADSYGTSVMSSLRH